MPIVKNGVQFVENFQRKFLCIDKSEMYVNGDFNSEKARNLHVQLKRCQNSNTPGSVKCKSEAEITAFFRNKYIIMLQN